ncbi:MAG: GerMN domain-containing protein [Clostridiaceae bacterium]
MKKIFFAIVLSIIFAIVLISCKSNENSNTSNKTPSVNSNNDTPTITEETSVKNTKCRLYFFNTSELKHYYIDKTLPIENGALITALTKELQSTSYDKDFLSLTDKIEVKSAKLDETTSVLKIVFSDSYVDHMNLGSSTESGLLTSLIATYGYNLGVDKIAIYFNDELYTCLKGDLPNGYFTVEYPPAEPYNP